MASPQKHSFYGVKILSCITNFPIVKGKPEGALAPSETVIPLPLTREGGQGVGYLIRI